MPSLNELSGVAHNIAHHSQSSLSWLHPHMGQACRLADVTVAEIELLEAHPYPLLLPEHKPFYPVSKQLVLALHGLQAKFWDIVEQQGISRSSVQSVRLTFRFLPLPADDYSCSVSAAIIAKDGKVFRRDI